MYLIALIIALIFFVIASYTDIKTREVPPFITTTLILIGLGFYLAISIINNDYSFVLSSLLSAVLCFVFSFILYKLGVWAGGDVKLFTGLGAMIPAYGSISYFPFFALACSLIGIFPFLLLYISYYLIKVPHVFKKSGTIFKTSLIKSIPIPFVLTTAYFLGEMVKFEYASVGIAILLFVFGKIGFFFSIAMTLLSFYPNFGTLGFFRGSLSATALYFIAISFYTIARKYVLRETKKISDLKEGDILAENLVVENGKYLFKNPSFFNFFNLNEMKKIKISAFNAGGLENKDIELIKKHGFERIELKKSLPFVPIFTTGIIIAVILEMLI